MTAADTGGAFVLWAQARESDDFRRVLITGSHMQIVLMTIPRGGEIGAETHPDTDQVLFFVDGEGESVLDDETTPVEPGHLVFVRAGTHHNFTNTGQTPLRFATARPTRTRGRDRAREQGGGRHRPPLTCLAFEKDLQRVRQPRDVPDAQQVQT